MSALVLTESHGAVFEIALNRADKRNAINWPMLTENFANGVQAMLTKLSPQWRGR